MIEQTKQNKTEFIYEQIKYNKGILAVHINSEIKGNIIEYTLECQRIESYFYPPPKHSLFFFLELHPTSINNQIYLISGVNEELTKFAQNLNNTAYHFIKNTFKINQTKNIKEYSKEYRTIFQSLNLTTIIMEINKSIQTDNMITEQMMTQPIVVGFKNPNNSQKNNTIEDIKNALRGIWGNNGQT